MHVRNKGHPCFIAMFILVVVIGWPCVVMAVDNPRSQAQLNSVSITAEMVNQPTAVSNQPIIGNDDNLMASPIDHVAAVQLPKLLNDGQSFLEATMVVVNDRTVITPSMLSGRSLLDFSPGYYETKAPDGVTFFSG